jgi:hypothetical protein
MVKPSKRTGSFVTIQDSYFLGRSGSALFWEARFGSALFLEAGYGSELELNAGPGSALSKKSRDLEAQNTAVESREAQYWGETAKNWGMEGLNFEDQWSQIRITYHFDENPDQDPHWSEKSDPDQQQSEKVDLVPR